MYVWNGLLMLKENEKVRLNHLDLINQAFKDLEERKSNLGSTVLHIYTICAEIFFKLFCPE